MKHFAFVFYIWSVILLKFIVSLLIFCLVVPSITKSRVLKSPAITVLQSITLVSSINVSLKFLCPYAGCMHTYFCYIFLVDLSFYHYVIFSLSSMITIDLKSILSRYSHPCSGLVNICIFLHLFTFSLCVPLNQK